ncbi:hypothetical protein EIP86_009403 [Pleurotus ostreatoroseus]|nr:hypothetical protein EIP86_009403 [Pleurotus ostreatoroseus]
MADAGDCLGALCAICSKCGAGSNAGGGLCGSCCKRSFDDDDFEKEEARLHAQAREREAAAASEASDENGNKGGEVPRRSASVSRDGSTVVSSQPAPAKTMEPPRRSEERERAA